MLYPLLQFFRKHRSLKLFHISLNSLYLKSRLFCGWGHHRGDEVHDESVQERQAASIPFAARFLLCDMSQTPVSESTFSC